MGGGLKANGDGEGGCGDSCLKSVAFSKFEAFDKFLDV